MEIIMVENETKKIVFASKKEVVVPKQVIYTVEGGNDWTIVAKKFLGGLVASFIAIGVPYTINFFQTQDLTGLPPWFIASVPIIVALLIAANNAWQHRLQITKEEIST
jgi:hypothetical protein